jgi:DNA-binding NtrC family response regulator
VTALDIKKHRILIIEDEALVARELKGRLTRMGCEVVGIAYGREAIAMARDTQPDLLLTDIHLKGGEDGIDMAIAIQSERDVPVVFLTAYSDEHTVSRAKSVTPYGYIIKPVENRELQIAIEMALYKFNIERELRATQQLLQNALACIGNALIFIDESGLVTDLNVDAQLILGLDRSEALGGPWTKVLGLGPASSLAIKINSALGSVEVTKLAAFILDSGNVSARLVDGIVGPMLPGGVLILRALSDLADPLEILPTADQLLGELGPGYIRPSESAMCQMLVAPEASLASNHDLLDAIAERLNKVLRSTDLVSVYGNAQLSVSLPYTGLDEGKQIAESVLRTLKATPFKQSVAAFSIGLAHSAVGDQQPFELFRRASWALHVAQEAGGGRVISWGEDSEQHHNDMTNDTARLREYHNVVLLWNLMSLVMKAGSIEAMSNKLCQHMQQSFDLVQAAIIVLSGDVMSTLGGALPGGALSSMSGLDLTEIEFQRLSECLRKGRAGHFGTIYIWPLPGMRCVYLQSKQPLAQVDREFMQSLIGYFSTGLDRFDHAPDSAADLSETSLIYQSPQMQSVLESCRLVAPTDATVLVSGESGTGKEMLAKAIHDFSTRAQQPYIIVDCGAMVGSLIESELFGHVKGAFTGADKQFSGRLKEAAGGTVLLDEIGELPLEVQVKLLRFVQERQIVAVGSSTYETVDTRIIAATNKDLKALVAAGQFREDLYYRLNVFAIESPPLRDRPEDILLLATHYLNSFAQRYSKPMHGFTMDAQQALRDYHWPGNVRELVNVINRGVILCKDSQMNSIQLGLFPRSDRLSSPSRPEAERNLLQEWLSKRVTVALKGALSGASEGVALVSIAGSGLPPLGQWLEEDLILACLATHGHVLNRAAAALAVPESTLRRKVLRIREIYGDDAPVRPADWHAATPLLEVLCQIAEAQQTPLLDMVAQHLLTELERRPISRKAAATLLGVSVPTYRRLST